MAHAPPPPPGRVEHPLGRLGRPIASILSPTDFPWPKNAYIKTPSTATWRGVTENHHRRKQLKTESRLEGEPLPELPPVAPPPSPTTPAPSPWWRGSSPPLDYGFVEVAWSKSLLFFIVLEPYELPYMIMAIFCNTYVVDLYSMIWSMRLEPILYEMYL